ncbi:MAG: hypothetical protein A3F68_04600 [Acidobacteria bacterium RIFCSPLOWO2_12_FULL_54_10]|nr:MAG: hypothetical protein A3F68_04600 [Acidobacteria bacterium RIFCSPLOWO2_12_FULL_54_10]
MYSKVRGFSLIELLIVVAIMLIIAAIAVPRFLRVKNSANETSAANSLRQMASASTNYYSRFNQGYAGSLGQLGPPGPSCASLGSDCADLIDSVLSGVLPAMATPVKSGYTFTYFAPNATPSPPSPNNSYAIVAAPVIPNSTGVSTFCVDNRGVILRDRSGMVTTAAPSGCAASWPVGGSIGPL